MKNKNDDIMNIDRKQYTIGNLIEAIDKNAHIYVLVKSNIIHSITDENVRELKDHFGLK